MGKQSGPQPEVEKPAASRSSRTRSDQGLISEVVKTLSSADGTLVSSLFRRLLGTKAGSQSQGEHTTRNYTGEFGRLALVDSSRSSAGEQRVSDIGDNKGHGDGPATRAAPASPEQAAKSIRAQADSELAALHAHLKVTTDGSAPREVAPQEHFTVTGSRTPLEIAKDMLGPKATDDQVRTYASSLMAENHITGSWKKPIAAGTTIRLPGQGADGSVYYQDKGDMNRDWADGTNMVIRADGSGSANYRIGHADVGVSWDPRNSDLSYRTQTEGKRQVETYGDGKVIESKLVTVKTDDGTGEEFQKTREKAVTKDGAIVTTEYGPNERVARETYEQKDGYRIVRSYDKKEHLAGISICEPDGHKTELTVNQQTGTIEGKRYDARGKLVDNVALMEHMLVYTDVRTGEKRADNFRAPSQDHADFEIFPAGKYDADSGTISSPGSFISEASFAPGRLGFGTAASR